MAGVAPAVPASYLQDAEKAFAEFFRIQGTVIAAHFDGSKTLGRKAGLGDVFDQARWDRVLLLEILAVALDVSQAAGRSVLIGLGLSADDYDADRTREWLHEHASGVASGINGVTRLAIADALVAGLPGAKVRDLFDAYARVRAPQIARTEVTAATGFGTQEAGHQSGQTLTKTWVTGANPRTSHAQLDGQTVPMRERFANGARWPGDSLLPNAERARCNCVMRVNAA